VKAETGRHHRRIRGPGAIARTGVWTAWSQDRSARAGLEAAKREIEHLGGQALIIPTDVGCDGCWTRGRFGRKTIRPHRYLGEQWHGFGFLACRRR
jgi:hypothetical protein